VAYQRKCCQRGNNKIIGWRLYLRKKTISKNPYLPPVTDANSAKMFARKYQDNKLW